MPSSFQYARNRDGSAYAGYEEEKELKECQKKEHAFFALFAEPRREFRIVVNIGQKIKSSGAVSVSENSSMSFLRSKRSSSCLIENFKKRRGGPKRMKTFIVLFSTTASISFGIWIGSTWPNQIRSVMYEKALVIIPTYEELYQSQCLLSKKWEWMYEECQHEQNMSRK
jgi:hypothetical protein